MKLNKENEIEMSPGELADLIEARRLEMTEKGTQKSYLDFMKILLESYDSIIYALRLADAEKEKPL